MTQPKKNPKQAKVTVKAARIGKKKRAAVIEQYRHIFNKHLPFHMEWNRQRGNRPLLIFSSMGRPKDLPTVERDKDSCPICSYRPYAKNIIAHPRLTLTEKDAEKFLRELGFADDFVKNYMEEFRIEKTERKEKSKSAWGIPNFGELISYHGANLLFQFPWLTVTTAAHIIEDLLKEKDHHPGKGTIKTHLEKFILTFQETSTFQDNDLLPPACANCPSYNIANCGSLLELKNLELKKSLEIKRLETIAKALTVSVPKQIRAKMNDERQIFDAIQAIEKPREETEESIKDAAEKTPE